MEHESATTIPVPPKRLYSALADVANLTRFIPPLKSVRRTDPEHVEVDAEYEGHAEHGQAWFRTAMRPIASNGDRRGTPTTGDCRSSPTETARS